MPTAVVSIFTAEDYASEVERAAGMLRDGGVVVLPTETVYGAAGLLAHPEARRKLAALRNGQTSQPFTVHVAEPADARRYIGPLTPFGERVMRKLWPGPVGLVFDVPTERRQQVAAETRVAESDLYDASGAITLRCPSQFTFTDVARRVNGPIAVTAIGSSAGQAPSEQTRAALDGRVDLILDAGPTQYSSSSTIVKVNAESYEIVREGVYDRRIIEKMLRTTILFVCSGNTCRSPMAEAIARRLLAEREGVPEAELEKKGLTVASAGAFAMAGSRATPQAAEAVQAMGADLSAHRSRPLTFELIHQADAIFTMARGHAAAVAAMVPAARDKVATLDPEGDIEDPIGGDLSLYQELAGQLRKLIEKRLADIR